jgi:hypothetical protein
MSPGWLPSQHVLSQPSPVGSGIRKTLPLGRQVLCQYTGQTAIVLGDSGPLFKRINVRNEAHDTRDTPTLAVQGDTDTEAVFGAFCSRVGRGAEGARLGVGVPSVCLEPKADTRFIFEILHYGARQMKVVVSSGITKGAGPNVLCSASNIALATVSGSTPPRSRISSIKGLP